MPIKHNVLLDLMPQPQWLAIEQAAYAAVRGDEFMAEEHRSHAGYDLRRLNGFGPAEGIVE